MKRNTHTLQVRVDPLAQDRLQWVIGCLEGAIPDMKVPSQSTIMRRALHVYVNYLGNILATKPVSHSNITGEAAHLAVARQNNCVFWPNAVFPKEEMVREDGAIVRFDLMERDAKKAKYTNDLDKLLKSEKQHG